jgi:hypothetical protein
VVKRDPPPNRIVTRSIRVSVEDVVTYASGRVAAMSLNKTLFEPNIPWNMPAQVYAEAIKDWQANHEPLLSAKQALINAVAHHLNIDQPGNITRPEDV